MSSNQYTTDVLSRHQLFIQRYSTGVSNSFVRDLKRINRDIRRRLADQELTSVSGARLRQVNLDIEQLISGKYNQAQTNLILELNKFAQQEVDFTANVINKATVAGYTSAIPDKTQIETAMEVQKFKPKTGQAIAISGALVAFGQKQNRDIRRIIADGYLLGQTNSEISKNIQNLGKITSRQADTLARTLTNHTSQIARTATASANSDVLRGVKWLSTLDDRTTLTCAGRDGTIYPVNSDYPKPPAHYNCRSTINLVVDPEFDAASKVTGERPEKGADGVGQTSANTTFGGWLKRQPASFQDEYFSKFPDGKERSALFRKGGLTIDKFTDSQGAVYSLSKLKELNPIEFAKADI